MIAEVEELEDEEYDIRPAMMGDGDVFIEDPIALMEQLGALALQVRDGALFALRKENMKWINVEDAMKQATRSTTLISAVKTRH